MALKVPQGKMKTIPLIVAAFPLTENNCTSGGCLSLVLIGDSSSFLASYITSPGDPFIVTILYAQCFLVLQPWEVVLPAVSLPDQWEFLTVKGGLI